MGGLIGLHGNGEASAGDVHVGGNGGVPVDEKGGGLAMGDHVGGGVSSGCFGRVKPVDEETEVGDSGSCPKDRGSDYELVLTIWGRPDGDVLPFEGTWVPFCWLEDAEFLEESARAEWARLFTNWLGRLGRVGGKGEGFPLFWYRGMGRCRSRCRVRGLRGVGVWRGSGGLVGMGRVTGPVVFIVGDEDFLSLGDIPFGLNVDAHGG